jgi:hypothetical protein
MRRSQEEKEVICRMYAKNVVACMLIVRVEETKRVRERNKDG